MTKTTKRLRTTNATILERCFIDEHAKLTLEGSEKLSEDYKQHHGFDPCLSCKCNEFHCAFTSEDKFFYRLDHFHDKGKLVVSEIGIGTLSDDKRTIDRLSIITRLSGEGEVIPAKAPYIARMHDVNEYMQIGTFTSGNLSELFVDPHVLVVGDREGLAKPLYVDKHSLLGRMTDEVTNISNMDLWNILCSFSKSLHLKAFSLYVRMLNVKAIAFSPMKRSKRTLKGTLYVDDQTNELSYYDGKHTHTIVMTRKD